MKKVVIIGLPGSGKSTFAIELGKKLNIAVHHLDKFKFLEDGTKRDSKEYQAIEDELVSGESWIIEGCALSTLENRFSKADTVFYFDLPRVTCIWRVFKRLFRSDPDTGCANFVNLELLKYIWNFKKEKWAQIEELKNKYPQVTFQSFVSDPHGR